MLNSIPKIRFNDQYRNLRNIFWNGPSKNRFLYIVVEAVCVMVSQFFLADVRFLSRHRVSGDPAGYARRLGAPRHIPRARRIHYGGATNVA